MPQGALFWEKYSSLPRQVRDADAFSVFCIWQYFVTKKTYLLLGIKRDFNDSTELAVMLDACSLCNIEY